jgi:protoheme IX farnesyltransferase
MSVPETQTAAMAEAVTDTAARSIVTQYYELTKPGITQMVALTTLAGFYLAIPTDLLTFAAVPKNWFTFLATMIGTILVSGGSCVFNHIMERDADARMKRTATRPIPSGAVTLTQAYVFGSVLTLVGLALISTVNMLTLALAVATWLSYVAVYTPLKKKTSIALLVGGIPGALPFAGGWTAMSNSFDVVALTLFAILFFWQLPHFLALSWMYRSDYREGGFVMRAINEPSGKVVGVQMIVTSVLTLASAVMPTILGTTGMLYAIGAGALGLWLTVASVQFLQRRDHTSARRVLLTSYAVLMGIIILMFVDKAHIIS